jgi:hypothetical protein
MNLFLKGIIASLILAFGISLSFFSPDKKENHNSPMGIGTPDDPNSLAAFELMRLADPATGEIPAGIRKRELDFANNLPVNMNRTIDWSLIGPKNIGGRTRTVKMDSRNENIILVGGVTGGIWRSSDGGASFVKTSDPGQIHSVTTIVQDTRTGYEDTWYAGTGEHYGIVSGTSFTSRFSGDGIFKSMDNGQTWTLLASTSSNTPHTLYANGDMDFVWKIVTDHTNLSEDEVYAAVYNGIFRSTNGGSTWTPVLGFDSTTVATSDYTDLIITDAGTLYASFSGDGPGTLKGVWRSDDGITWTNITSGFPGNFERIAMTFNPNNNNELMMVMESPGTGAHDHSLLKYTYLSGNGSGAGGQWENRTANLPDGSCTGYFTFDFGYFHTQSSYDMFIAWHPSNDSIIFLGGTNLYRTTTQFTTPDYSWIGGYQCNQQNVASYVYPNHHPDQHGMIFYDSNNARAISCNDGGIYRTDDVLADSVIWESLNNGYVTTQFYTISLEEGNTNTDFLVAGAQDNGTWFTNRNHLDSMWKWVYNGDGSFASIPNGRPFYILSIQQGKMYKVFMDDNGDTLSSTRIDPTGGPTNYNFINAFMLDPNDNNRLYLTARTRIWRNDDLAAIPVTGDIYNTISTGWTNIAASQIGSSDGVISVVEMSPALPDVVYYGTSKTKLYKLDDASGATPVKTNLTSTLFPLNAYLSSISANPFDGAELMITYSNYSIPSIFYSVDGGATFTDISGNLEQNADGSGNGPAVYWSLIYPSPQPVYFVGTSIGLFSTTEIDGANTIWQMESPAEIGRVVINMIKARTYDGKIVVATHGNGIYSAQLDPAFTGVNENENAGVNISAYPNPFTDYVTITFGEQNENSTIEIFDIRGVKIKTIAVDKISSIYSWNGTNDSGNKVSNGTYFVVVKANGHVTTIAVLKK